MISAGYIGGGHGEVAPPPVAVSVGSDNLPGDKITDGTIMGDLKQMYGWNILGNSFNQGIQFLFSWLAQRTMWGAQKSIMNRQADAAEHISTDRRATEEKMIDFMDEADDRMNGRNGLRERLAEIESNRDLAMYDRRMDSQERIAAMRELDNAFSVRSDYSNYGSPSIYG